LITLYFVLHPGEKAFLAGFNMFEAYFGGPTAGRFFLYSFSHPLADEERDFRYGFIGLTGPFHRGNS
jgi:hypothetical protein